MFLTQKQFLEYFPPIHITREDFIKQFIVTYVGCPTLQDLFEFKSVIKSPNDKRYINKEKIISYLYDVIIINRHKYLTVFYNNYLKLPDMYTLKWDNVNICHHQNVDFDDQYFITEWKKHMNDDPNADIKYQFNKLIDQPLSSLSLQKNDNSRKLIRNLNYLDILHSTRITNTCKSKVSFWQSLLNTYNKLQLEDRFFAPSSVDLCLKTKQNSDINFQQFFYLFQQYQPKASILNPFTINWIMKNIFQGKRIFTPVLSWGSYLCAFMHTDWEHYVGVDVMPNVCERCNFLFNYYQNTLSPNQNKHINIYCKPSETLLQDQSFIKQYQDYFDAVLICPPYFDMEVYPTGEQSIKLYPTYENWLIQYWENTLKLCNLVLKKHQKLGFIINNYTSLNKKTYPLIQDLNIIALKYFKLIDVYQLLNRVSPLRMNKKNRTEMLFIYEKIKN